MRIKKKTLFISCGVSLVLLSLLFIVMVSISAYGIQISQKNARNTLRRKVVQDITVGFQDIKSTDIVEKLILKNMTIYALQLDPIGLAFKQNKYKEIPITNVSGFSNIEITNDGCNFLSEENVPTNIYICYDSSNKAIGTRIEGSDIGFLINH